MITYRLLDSLPIPVLFLLLFVLLMLAYEGGFRLGLRRQAPFEEGKRSQAGPVVGSLLGLVAFFLAFTFGGANSQFNTRKQLVTEEANAIGTFYLRAQLMPEPYRSQIVDQLSAYVDQRVLGTEYAAVRDYAGVAEVVAQSETILDTLWQQIVALSSVKIPDPLTRVLLIESLNQVIDMHTKRVAAAMRARLPTVIWGTLGFAIVIAVSVFGYHGGLSGVRSLFAIGALVLSLSFVFVLIVTLDRPGGALFAINQQAMIDLKKTLSK